MKLTEKRIRNHQKKITLKYAELERKTTLLKQYKGKIILNAKTKRRKIFI